MITVAQLKSAAREIRNFAKYANGQAYRDEINKAIKLEHQANELERREKEEEALRKKLIRKVKTGQSKLSLDDATYRDLLESQTGKRSATKLKLWELEKVIKRMFELGFKPSKSNRSGNRKQANDPQSRKIRSLWIQLHEAGKVRDSSEKALVSWAKNSLKTTHGIEALQWLNSAQKSKLIESLKQWLAR